MSSSHSCYYVGEVSPEKLTFRPYENRNPQCKGLEGQCPGKVYWQRCFNTHTRFDCHWKSGWGLLRHRGVHNHQWPSSKKPDPLSMQDLADAVKNNPKASALQLKVRKKCFWLFFLTWESSCLFCSIILFCLQSCFTHPLISLSLSI